MTLQRERFDTRFDADPWRLAHEYMGWFAVECHYTFEQVMDSQPWAVLVRLTLLADDMAEQRRKQAEQAQGRTTPMQRMA